MTLASPEQWADAVRDSIALVTAARADDMLGCKAVLRNADCELTMVTLAKLMSEACDDLDVTPEHFRSWAQSAVNRP
jgi:hypothetical protein